VLNSGLKKTFKALEHTKTVLRAARVPKTTFKPCLRAKKCLSRLESPVFPSSIACATDLAVFCWWPINFYKEKATMATAKTPAKKAAPATKAAPTKAAAAPAKKAAPVAKVAAPAKAAAPAAKVAAKAAAPAKKAPAKKAAVEKAPAAKRAVNAAFLKPLTPSAALAAVIGATPIPRTEIVKQLWVYIKKHGLQDAVNKRMINADTKLKAFFGKAQVSMFEMAGIIGKHVK
jgi:upstream activation factor subunit UAF30